MIERKAYKIRIKGSSSYSNGVINVYRDTVTKKSFPECKWNRKGKEWADEKNVKAHLTKYVSLGGSISTWEVVEVVYHPTKPIDDWVDAKMLMKILQNQ